MEDDNVRIEAALPSILDEPWTDLPPWRIAVLPLRPTSKDPSRCFIAFAFSHALGDGNIGMAFHRTFLNAILNPATTVNMDSTWVMTPDKELAIPFDTPERLPISWKFLLAPLLAVLLPKSIANMFGLRATASEVNSQTWTGSKMFFDRSTFYSCPRLMEIDAAQVERALNLARKHDARLTSLIHQFIIRALSKTIPGREFDNFVSGTAVDMRRSIGVSKDEMGLFVNAYHGLHARQSDFTLPLSEEAWAEARFMTEKLAECATSLHDQAVGLLRYVPSIRKWTAAKIGQERDCSYELSNLGVFDVGTPLGSSCKVTKAVFARPVDAIGTPLAFTMMSVKNGSLVISVSWQQGALGVPIESESSLIDGICESLRQDFEQLA
jgi:Alcohol acetyltransferase